MAESEFFPPRNRGAGRARSPLSDELFRCDRQVIPPINWARAVRGLTMRPTL
jgi:hypothetical protein